MNGAENYKSELMCVYICDCMRAREYVHSTSVEAAEL